MVRLENQELWRRFNEIGTEMIITKTGRWVNVTQLLASPNVANLLHFHKNSHIYLSSEKRREK